MAVILKFGNIGGTHSDSITCKSRTIAATLAANIVFVQGGYSTGADDTKHWTLDNTTRRLYWENRDKTFFVEVTRE